MFCSMAWHSLDEEMQPTQLFLMAAKYNFISQNIETGSFVYLRILDDFCAALLVSSPFSNVMDAYYMVHYLVLLLILIIRQ